ncbi:MAG: dihydroorotase family protein [Alphaproteobacteria bacterium]
MVDRTRTAYVNARLVDPESGLDARGELLTEAGTIVDRGARLFEGAPPEDAEVVDCGGHVLAPGLIDTRVQLREPGEEHKEDIHSGSRSAAAGGVSCMVALPNTEPVIDDISLVEFIARRGREVKLVKVFCHAAVTRALAGREICEMGLLGEAGAIAFTDGVRAVADAGVMRRALSYARTFGALIVQHPEEPRLADDGAMNAGEMSTRLGLPGIPREAEHIMLDRDLTLVEMTGGRYHAAHISTAPAVDRIRAAKNRGLDVTCDTAPVYFALNEIAVGDYRTFAKLSPPLRSEEDRQAIVAGLADATIDLIASDHAPQDEDSKRLPFAQAEFGAVGIETLLPLVLELVHNRHLSLVEALRKVTCAPVARFGLPGGRLAPGTAADLVLFDPERPWRIEADGFLSKSKNSPFDGRLVQGRVLRTVVDGRPVHVADDPRVGER